MEGIWEESRLSYPELPASECIVDRDMRENLYRIDTFTINKKYVIFLLKYNYRGNT